MSNKVGKKFQSVKEDTSLNISNLDSRYSKLKPKLNDSLKFEIKYLLISFGVLIATFANIHKNVSYNLI